MQISRRNLFSMLLAPALIPAGLAAKVLAPKSNNQYDILRADVVGSKYGDYLTKADIRKAVDQLIAASPQPSFYICNGRALIC